MTREDRKKYNEWSRELRRLTKKYDIAYAAGASHTHHSIQSTMRDIGWKMRELEKKYKKEAK